MENKYHGRPCKYGHGTLRYVSSCNCVKCAALTRDKHRLADLPKNRKQDRDRRRAAHRKDPRRKMLKTAERRAKENGLPFAITLEDIVVPERCPLLGVQLKINSGSHGPNSPSLDGGRTHRLGAPSYVHRATRVRTPKTANRHR